MTLKSALFQDYTPVLSFGFVSWLQCFCSWYQILTCLLTTVLSHPPACDILTTIPLTTPGYFPDFATSFLLQCTHRQSVIILGTMTWESSRESLYLFEGIRWEVLEDSLDITSQSSQYQTDYSLKDWLLWWECRCNLGLPKCCRFYTSAGGCLWINDQVA